MSRVGETGIGETGVGEMGVGETGPNHAQEHNMKPLMEMEARTSQFRINALPPGNPAPLSWILTSMMQTLKCLAH